MLWRALERAIPDIRERAELSLVGTPLTHARFLRRHHGSYGPAISAASGSFPGPQTDVPGLFRRASRPGLPSLLDWQRAAEVSALSLQVWRLDHAWHRRTGGGRQRHDLRQHAVLRLEPPASPV